MFTGIIEQLGKVVRLEKDSDNLHLSIQAPFTQELKVDQSVAHNGVCLTVVSISDREYTVTAIRETLDKTSLGLLEVGSVVNLERCMQIGGRLDGHIVQGHVDTTAEVLSIDDASGSWEFRFKFNPEHGNLLVDKGSVTVNGVSLTVVNPTDNAFSVAIIPYTYEHTNFHSLRVGDKVNLEFDIIGKYVQRMMAPRMS